MVATSEMTKQGTPEEFWARAQGHAQTESDLRADLAALESQAGGVMLDDPGAAEALVGRVASLRARADLESRAAAEARARAQAGRVAALRGEADALQPEVSRIRRELGAYQKQRDKLLKALEEFTRAEWVLKPEPDVAFVGTFSRPQRPDEALVGELRVVEQRQEVLRALADSVEADREWAPDSVRELVRVRASWAEALAGHREARTALVEALTVIDDVAAIRGCTRGDVMADRGGDYRSAQLHDFCEAVPRAEAHLSMFWDDVRSHRAQGLVLSDGEVRDLAVELGLDVPEEFAADVDSGEVLEGPSDDDDDAEVD